jgi:SAM-dependent methyltransferase
MVEQRAGDPIYAVGYTEEELQRLMAQGRLFADVTRHFLVDAGIGPGMRVLDVGCGVGDVSLQVASLVGPSGAVVGIDINPRSVELARARAAEAGCNQMTFLQGNLRELVFDEPFDAAVGRHVLIYQADPAEAVRQVAAHVRPGGVVAFQEYQMQYTPLLGGGVPLFDRYRLWIEDTLRRAGVETQMGGKIQGLFLRGGLPTPHMHIDGLVCNATNGNLASEVAAETLRSLLPLMERFGIATASEVELETIKQRFQREYFDNQRAWSAQPVVGAWARKESEVARVSGVY